VENTENKKIFVAGCGGLGCYIVENFLRMNIAAITVCDGDVFSESNLNRQLYSSPENIGQKKVFCARKRAKELGYKGNFNAIDVFINEANAEALIGDADIALDALDNTHARFILEDACSKKNIPMIHGAVGEWNFQISAVMPKSNFLHNLFGGSDRKNDIPTYAFTVEACASVQTAEALKLLRGEKTELKNSLLLADLRTNSYEIIKLTC